jgi:rhodanese-related sulfurtransferase
MRPNLRYVSLAICLVLGLTAIAASQSTKGVENVPSPSPPSVAAISVHDLQTLMTKDPSVPIYDVRQPEEYNKGHIKGAILMSLGDLPGRYKEIPRKKRIVVYCQAGKRGALAVEFLRAHGYSDAVNLSGGYLEWSRAQQPSVK